MQEKNVAEPTNSLAMDYRDELLKRQLSRKTIKDYLAAIKQFLNWCMAHDIIKLNPFNIVKLSAVTGKGSTSRKHWQPRDLQRFMQSQCIKSKASNLTGSLRISCIMGLDHQKHVSYIFLILNLAICIVSTFQIQVEISTLKIYP